MGKYEETTPGLRDLLKKFCSGYIQSSYHPQKQCYGEVIASRC